MNMFNIYSVIYIVLPQADKAHTVITMLENLVFGSSKPVEVIKKGDFHTCHYGIALLTLFTKVPNGLETI